MDRITALLFENADEGYKRFHCSLVPSLNPNTVIGVRKPALQAIAKALLKNKSFAASELSAFLSELPHTYYEENMLHALFISSEKSFERAMHLTELFLPYVDNWAICDSFSPKCFAAHVDALWTRIEHWLLSEHTYTVRFGIVNTMRYFLDDAFDEGKLKRVLSIKSSEYYINMAIAWYMSTALVKQYDIAVKYLENRSLDVWLHNKSIQKAVESFRISVEQKTYLKSLKIHE